MAKEFTWQKDFDEVLNVDWKASPPRTQWFSGGKLNVSVNCLDRHIAAGNGSSPCFTFEADNGYPAPPFFRTLQEC